jgi:hypothetical protein
MMSPTACFRQRREDKMPTLLMPRTSRVRARPSMFLLWAIALCAASVAIECLDPAPMDVAAAWIASP